MKICFKCGGEKDLDDFYKHPKMADGHLNKCKECTRADAAMNYADDPEKHKAYDRNRQQIPERRAKKIQYQARRRTLHRDRYRANQILGNAVRDGRVIRMPCEVCGDTKSEAHHDDYSFPLLVRRLCFKHHRKLHGQEVK